MIRFLLLFFALTNCKTIQREDADSKGITIPPESYVDKPGFVVLDLSEDSVRTRVVYTRAEADFEGDHDHLVFAFEKLPNMEHALGKAVPLKEFLDRGENFFLEAISADDRGEGGLGLSAGQAPAKPVPATPAVKKSFLARVKESTFVEFLAYSTLQTTIGMTALFSGDVGISDIGTDFSKIWEFTSSFDHAHGNFGAAFQEFVKKHNFDSKYQRFDKHFNDWCDGILTTNWGPDAALNRAIQPLQRFGAQFKEFTGVGPLERAASKSMASRLVYGGLFAPVVDEVVFRYGLQEMAMRRMPKKALAYLGYKPEAVDKILESNWLKAARVVTSSAIYAASVTSTDFRVPHFAMGLIAGYYMEKTGSLWNAIRAHAVWNTPFMALFLRYESNAANQAPTLREVKPIDKLPAVLAENATLEQNKAAVLAEIDQDFGIKARPADGSNAAKVKEIPVVNPIKVDMEPKGKVKPTEPKVDVKAPKVKA